MDMGTWGIAVTCGALHSGKLQEIECCLKLRVVVAGMRRLSAVDKSTRLLAGHKNRICLLSLTLLGFRGTGGSGISLR